MIDRLLPIIAGILTIGTVCFCGYVIGYSLNQIR